MLSDRRTRFTSFGSFDTDYKSDSSRPSLRRIGRMYTSPSLDRLSALEGSHMTRHKSILDLSKGYETSSSLGTSFGTPIVHRNASFQKARTNVWRQSENKRLFDTNRPSVLSSRTDVYSKDRYNGISSSASHSSTPSRFDPISVLDRRDELFSQLKAASSPKVGRRSKPQSGNRSNLTPFRHWSPITTSDDNWRARLRERPLLSNLTIKPTKSRSKTPITSSGLSSRTSSTSSTKYEDNVNNDGKDESSGIYRNRYIIKFREHNLGQTPSQRRSSITWDLPKTLTSVVPSNESPIAEDLETEVKLEIKDAESGKEIKEKESVPKTLNQSNESKVNQKEIENEEKMKGLVSDQQIITKSITNESQPKCNASQVVIDILPIHTADMPEPNGTDSLIVPPQQQKSVSLKSVSKPIDEQNVKKVSETNSPKKKKVKKKVPKGKSFYFIHL